MDYITISNISSYYTDDQVRAVFETQKIGQIMRIFKRDKDTITCILDFAETTLGQQIQKVVVRDKLTMRIQPNSTTYWTLVKTNHFVEAKFDEHFHQIMDIMKHNYTLLERIHNEIEREIS